MVLLLVDLLLVVVGVDLFLFFLRLEVELLVVVDLRLVGVGLLPVAPPERVRGCKIVSSKIVNSG